jgi:hypothetical protein
MLCTARSCCAAASAPALALPPSVLALAARSGAAANVRSGGMHAARSWD